MENKTAEEIEKLKSIWESRNPQHEVNSDTGEDMFWSTLLMVVKDFNASQSAPKEVEIKLPTPREIDYEVRKRNLKTDEEKQAFVDGIYWLTTQSGKEGEDGRK